MNKELTDKILNKYPDMFGVEPNRGPQKPHRFRFECGDGWFDILWRLCDDLFAMRPHVLQVKEKFGGLRFYASFTGDYTKQAWDRIRKAEEEASETCEECGQPGDMQIVNGWRSTVCDKCHEKWLSRASATDD